MAISINKTSGGGLGINGIIEKYVVQAGSNINAGDFVEFVNGSGNNFKGNKDNIIASGANAYYYASAVALSDTKVFIAHRTGGGRTLSALICTISETTISMGTDTVIASGSTAYYFASATALSESKVFVAHKTGGDSSFSAIVCDIVDTTITVGTDTVINSESTAYYVALAVTLSDSKVFIIHKTGDDTTLSTMMCNISGTTITTLGTDTIITSGRNSHVGASAVALSESKVFVTHRTNDDNTLSAIICNVSDTAITPGTDTEIVGGLGDPYESVSVIALSESKVFVTHQTNSNGALSAIICNVNITFSIIMPETSTVITSGRDSCKYTSLALLSGSKVFIAHQTGNDTSLSAIVCNITGAEITPNVDIAITNGSNSCEYTSSVLLSNSKVFIAHRTGDSDTLSAIICTPAPEIIPVTSTLQLIGGVAKQLGAAGQEVDVFVPVVTTPPPQTDYEKLTSGEAYKYYNVGDTVTINMSGYGDVVFDVISKDHDGEGTVTIVTKNIVEYTNWNSEATNNYSTSSIRTYLNGTILSKFDSAIQNAIKAVPKECHDRSTAVTCTDKVWLLSYTEVGFSESSNAPIEGTSYGFWTDNTSRIKTYNDVTSYWWLRTPNTDRPYFAWGVYTSGSSFYDYHVTDSGGGLVFGLVF